MKKIIFISILIFFNFINANSEVKPILVGSADSKVKLMVFESLTCSHCANFHKNIYPKLKEEFIDKGLLSIEFKSFPLDMVALNASKLAHCKNDGKSDILHLLYINQEKWLKGKNINEVNIKIGEFVKSSNINLNFEKCMKNQKVEDQILEDRIEGVKKYEVNSTPTIIINGKKLENHSNYKKLKKYIEKLI